MADLCRAAMGPNDYVLDYLDAMVAAGEAVVTEDRGRVAAMGGVTECADRALWIGQMRTHPEVRRRGYARLFLQETFARAVGEGRPGLRLWSSAGNTPARRLFEATGFAVVGRFTHLVAAATKGRTGLERGGETREVYERWRRSAFCRVGKGYLSYHWHFLPLSPNILDMMRRKDDLLVGPRAALFVWSEQDDGPIWVALLAGGREALAAARRLAHARGRERVEVFLPVDRRIVGWAAHEGYAKAEWGTRAVLYEWKVGHAGS